MFLLFVFLSFVLGSALFKKWAKDWFRVLNLQLSGDLKFLGAPVVGHLCYFEIIRVMSTNCSYPFGAGIIFLNFSTPCI